MALSQITFEFEDGSQKKNEDKKIVPQSSGALKPKRGRKSLKEMGLDADLIEIPADEILFQKQYYSIGDVAAMFKENTSLIRYWENEFTILKPKKNPNKKLQIFIFLIQHLNWFLLSFLNLLLFFFVCLNKFIRFFLAIFFSFILINWKPIKRIYY